MRKKRENSEAEPDRNYGIEREREELKKREEWR